MVATCFVALGAIHLQTQTLQPTSTSACRVQPTAFFRLPGSNNKSFGKNSFGSTGRHNSKYGNGGKWGDDDGQGGNRGGGGRNSGAGSGSSGGDGNIFSKIWAGYNSKLDKFPITTKAMTSLIGFFLGDVLAQKFLGEKGAAFDWYRVARMASFGFLIHGPTGHYFYSALDRLIVGTSPIKVASKVVIDQVFWAPIFTALFFSYLGFAEGKSMDEVYTKVTNDTWTGVTTSWKFWPLAHTINFAFIPTSQRLLYVNTLQVGYNVILSILGNK